MRTSDDIGAEASPEALFEPEGSVVDEGAGGAETARRAAVGEPRLCAWLARVVDRDEAALGALHDALASRVYGLALRITRNAQMAEEVTGDTFWQIWRQAPRFDQERGAALAWILTLARSRALDALRRKDRAACSGDVADLADEAGPHQDDPQDILLAAEQGQRLHTALAQLEPVHRQLLALAYFRGLSHEEIASRTEIPLGTVKSHIRRSLRKLQAWLPADSNGVAS